MKLNHLNLSVTDVKQAHAFLRTYFGLEGSEPNANIGFLRDDDGFVLTLTSPKVGGETEVRYPATFHVGFIQPSEVHVDRINQRLKADGFDVPPPSRQHGSWTFYFQAPGGVLVEVLA
jgi:catechol 2,3-dioxygenase-like lactoylglutathione lyase family enzyme